MCTVVKYSWSLLLLGLLALNVSAQSFFGSNSYKSYRHDTILPGPIEGHLSLGGSPLSISTGFHLKNPPQLPFAPLAVNNPFLPPGNLLAQSHLRIPPFFPANLFTPNTLNQPAETAGQVENYHKALEEEAEEAEKELNSLTTTGFGDSLLDTSEPPKSYVSVVHVKGDKKYDYGYSV